MNATELRRVILRQSFKAGVGHIGSALSIADMICVLFSRVLRYEPGNPGERDRFVLSKGHAALALYGVLHMKGLLSKEQLDTFHQDGSLLGVHPEHVLAGVDFCSGSLGQGMTYAAGAALAAQLDGSARRVYAIVSDAECNEGSVWEAAMFSAHRKLDQLTVLVDLNGQQALGYTQDVCAIPNMLHRWESFGWQATTIDGHDEEQIHSALESGNRTRGRPHVVIARTIFGKGVSFMQNKIEWHYLPVSETLFEQAMKEIDT